MRLLLVEDDALLGDGLQAGLKQKGYTVDWARDGEDAVTALQAESYGAIVLDVGLPRLSGIEVLRQIRSKGNQVPVLILTAKDSISDRVAGLDAGADDYLVKPFDMEELTARLRALLRRASGRANSVLIHGALELDPASHLLTYQGREVELGPKEFAVLHELLENAGRVLSRERLEQALYGWGEEVESNAVEVHVHHLRKKLGADLIRTIRGVGYMIEKPGKGRSGGKA